MKAFLMFLIISGICLAQNAGPKISAQKLDHDFGNIKQNQFVEHDFLVTNTGDEPLIITEVRAQCGCTAARPEKSTLKPGESTKINVKFNTIGREGRQLKSVDVLSNAKDNPDLRLSFTANVLKEEAAQLNVSKAKLVFDSYQHDFGKMEEGKIVEWKASFRNEGSGLLEIKDIRTSCGCTAAVPSGRRIEPGKTGSLRIEFDSSNKSGQVSRTVTIITNDPEKPEQTLVINADVSQTK